MKLLANTLKYQHMNLISYSVVTLFEIWTCHSTSEWCYEQQKSNGILAEIHCEVCPTGQAIITTCIHNCLVSKIPPRIKSQWNVLLVKKSDTPDNVDSMKSRHLVVRKVENVPEAQCRLKCSNQGILIKLVGKLFRMSFVTIRNKTRTTCPFTKPISSLSLPLKKD